MGQAATALQTRGAQAGQGEVAGRKVHGSHLCPSASLLCLTFVLFLVAVWLHFLPLLFPSKILPRPNSWLPLKQNLGE